MGLHDVEASLKLPCGPDEGDHEANVGGGIGDAAEHVQLKIEQIRLAGVAVAPPVADHRVCLVRFVCLPALQAAEFVGTKIDAAVDNRARREGASDLQQ